MQIHMHNLKNANSHAHAMAKLIHSALTRKHILDTYANANANGQIGKMMADHHNTRTDTYTPEACTPKTRKHAHARHTIASSHARAHTYPGGVHSRVIAMRKVLHVHVARLRHHRGAALHTEPRLHIEQRPQFLRH